MLCSGNERSTILLMVAIGCMIAGCNSNAGNTGLRNDSLQTATLQPLIETATVPHDTDDPAIWINPADVSQSLVLGTDKDENGGLYVFTLDGKIDTAKSVKGLKRPNNVDVEYGLLLAGKRIDIAVTTERLTHKLRVFSLPGMQPIDDGGLEVFVGETKEGYRDLMGIALYRSPAGAIYAIAGRKTGPTDSSYLWQYLLQDDGTGKLSATLVRKFGAYSGKLEIEAIAVDDQLGFVYYSDEGTGVRKYYADPARGNTELALFAREGFTEDHEGIAIYNSTDSTGFILVSDQGANKLQVFKREGAPSNPHQHEVIKTIKVAAQHTDGIDATSVPLNGQFKRGLVVAMNDQQNFHFYTPESVIGDSLLNNR